MLRITQSNSASGASKYFEEGLEKSDYYSKDDNKSIGRWGGKTAEKLGLSNDIKKEDFDKLANNINPETDEKLNPRNKDNRKVGYDMTFSAPKSASVLYAINNDERIKSAFETSVNETMTEMESDMMTQKGQGKQKRHEKTGNMVWGEFTHKTSRPVGGKPDCHLHTHCFAFNTTWNEEKQRFQAGEFGNIKRNAPYYETAFNSRFAKKMQGLGYEVERDRNTWKVAGIDKSTTDKFSNRTKQIEAEATKRGITNAKTKSKLGAKTRSSKRVGESYEELREMWKARLSKDEKNSINNLGKKELKEANTNQVAKKAIDHSMSHIFERKSATSEKALLREALKQNFGKATPEDLKSELNSRDTIKSEIKNNTYITTKEALSLEKNLIKNVRESRGKFKAINSNYKPKADYLNKEQKNAIKHVLTSKDGVMMIEGAAGTGKTTLMKEVKEGISEKGKRLYGFAPSAAASRGVMREEGFNKADTITKFLNDKKMQMKTSNQVIWIDEAGMVGNKTMNKIFKVAKENNARVLLTGDTKQHTAVEAGDSMRIIQERSGIKVASVNEIQRQRNAKDYKQAVKLISQGEISRGFDKLDSMGNVKEIADKKDRQQQIASDFVDAKKAKKTVLVVAPTHKEGREVTETIRTRLKNEKLLGQDEKTFTQQKNLNFTEAEKKDTTNYQKGMAVQFHQNAKGFVAGRKYDVIGKNDKGEVILNSKNGVPKKLHTTSSKRFTVFEKDKINVAIGDTIRITKNGKSIEQKRLNNGDMFQIKGFDTNGNIQLSNGSKIDKDFRNFNHGYVITSHSSQGKTVDNVLIAQSDTSFPASSQKQFYVSVSRGREQAKIYTNDKKGLKNTIQGSGDRVTASNIYDISKHQDFVTRSNYQKESAVTNTPTKQMTNAK